jgi:Ca2+-binding RTX toxin-like protein
MGSGVTLLGSNYTDVLKGSSSWDVLVGGYGKDTLTGGTGGDQFTIHSAADSRQMPGGSVGLADLITDFTINQLDTIHLEGLGLGSSSITERAQGAFVTASTTNFFGGNDIAVQSDGVSETRLYGDVNHNGAFDVGVDVIIRLVGTNQAHDLASNPILVVT